MRKRRKCVRESKREKEETEEKRKIGFFKDGSCDSWGLYTFRLLFWFNYDNDLLLIFLYTLNSFFVALVGFVGFLWILLL